MTLTEVDRAAIVRALEVAEERPGADLNALAEALGRAQAYIRELVAIAERQAAGT